MFKIFKLLFILFSKCVSEISFTGRTAKPVAIVVCSSPTIFAYTGVVATGEEYQAGARGVPLHLLKTCGEIRTRAEEQGKQVKK